MLDFIQYLTTPGEQLLNLEGLAGPVEAALVVPEHIRVNKVAFLGHPHSLQGGTMNNKVVTTMVRVFKELGIPSLRFNFPGVGRSAGSYDSGIAESAQMLALVRAWQEQQPNAQLFFSGFSFGSYVTYRAACQCPGASLITIAPPVHHYNYTEYETIPRPWLVVQGEEDEVTPVDLAIDFAQSFTPALNLMEFSKTGHFFHGKLIELKDQLIQYLRPQVSAL